jgi:hypothetical protein
VWVWASVLSSLHHSCLIGNTGMVRETALCATAPSRALSKLTNGKFASQTAKSYINYSYFFLNFTGNMIVLQIFKNGLSHIQGQMPQSKTVLSVSKKVIYCSEQQLFILQLICSCWENYWQVNRNNCNGEYWWQWEEKGQTQSIKPYFLSHTIPSSAVYGNCCSKPFSSLHHHCLTSLHHHCLLTRHQNGPSSINPFPTTPTQFSF